MKKRIVSIMLVVALVCLSLFGCGVGDKLGSDGKADNSDTEDAKETVYTEDGKIELTFWTTYGSKTLKYLQDIIDDFNESQDTYYVVSQNNGNHTQIRTKLLASDKKNYPSLICGMAANTGYYASSGVVAAIQDFIEADSDDWSSRLYEAVRNTYCDTEGKLWGYPLGVSCSGYYVNVDALKKAGYTVSDISSFEKVTEIAKSVTKKEICKYGLSFYGNGIELVDMLTLQGVDMVDNDNGFSGTPTKTTLSEGEGYQAVEKVANLVADLYNANAVLTYSATENFSMFNSGNLAMVYATNSWTHYVVDGSPDFEYTFVPSVGIDENAEYKGYVLNEGTGMYIANNGNKEEMQGAYEFIKFMSKPENQSYWCQALGYMTNTAEAAAEESYAAWMNKNLPALKDIMAQIQETPKELRTPYVECANELMSVGVTLLSYISVDSEGDLKPYIEESVEYLQEGIDVLQQRRQ